MDEKLFFGVLDLLQDLQERVEKLEQEKELSELREKKGLTLEEFEKYKFDWDD